MKIVLPVLLCLLGLNLNAQHTYKLELEINYGLQGNFFVRDFDEISGPGNPVYFYKKKFIGTIGGIESKLYIGKNSYFIAAFNRSENKGRKNYAGRMNNVDIFINNFQLRHINKLVQVGYGRKIQSSKSNYFIDIGAVLLYDNDQAI